MAILKEIMGPFNRPAGDSYWIIGEVHLLPLDGVAVLIPYGFSDEEEAEAAKSVRITRTKQDAEQKAWRVRRSEWLASHPPQELFEEPEPFNPIPPMPDILKGEPVRVNLADYLTLENSLKKQKLNFWTVLYGLLKDARFSRQFEGARDV